MGIAGRKVKKKKKDSKEDGRYGKLILHRFGWHNHM